MEITIAKHAGFCFGVKRATDRLETAIRDKREGERIYTLGTLFTSPATLNIGAAIAGLAAVLVMIVGIAALAVHSNKKMKAEYALK